jgi:AAA domain/RepB DNA-primase from phage plasmid
VDVNEQLKLLRRIWREQRGYVFLPYIPLELARGPERKRSLRNGPAFALGDWDAMRDHLAKHREDELYFAPMVFSQPRRRSEYATKCSRLWADLDEINPDQIPPDLTPNILWETSPGRYAAVWFMGSRRPETTERGGENHKLTIALGADPSGWDTTQLLRVPGSANNKPGYKRGIRGRLISSELGSHTWDDIDQLPEIPEAETVGGDLINDQLLDGVDAFEAYARLKRKLPGIVRQYMRLKDADNSMDRSSIAWQIERSLADAGATLLEMVAIIRPTPWNKFEGRDDELKRLTLECGKALSLRKAQPEEQQLEDEEERKHDLVPFWRNEAFLSAPEPEWLFDEFIPRGGCGFISGIPKSMKSWLALDLAVCAAQGIPYLGYGIERPIHVLYLQQEDPTVLVKARLNTIATSKHPRWSLDRPLHELKPYPGQLFIEVYSGFQGNDPGWQTWLDEMIRRHDISLVILDTLATIAPGTDTDSGTAVKQELLDPIKEIARNMNCAMCFVHHNTKAQSNARAAQNMAGSGQVHAWADFGIYITEKNEGFDFVEVDFTHETKYTGTRELRFRMEGLPERWDPEERLKEVTQKSRKGKRVDATVTPDGELEIDMNTVPERKERKVKLHPNRVLVETILKLNPKATIDDVVEATELTRGQAGFHLKAARKMKQR